MKSTGWMAFAAVAMMTVVASAPARAQSGLNLAWDDCAGSGNESYDKNVACTNAGIHNLIGSFIFSQPFPVLGAEWTMDIALDTASLPSWWSASHSRYTWSAQNPTGASCQSEFWSQAPHGAVETQLQFSQPAPHRLRLLGGLAFLPSEEQMVNPGIEYYHHTLQIRFTQGTADDPGCYERGCLRFSQLLLFAPEDHGARIYIMGPYEIDVVTWRDGWLLCYVPNRRSTWGSLKALYR